MVTVAEIAAFLGVTPSAVRQAIRRHRIQPAGRRWKAKLYHPQDVFRHTGTHDRLAA